MTPRHRYAEYAHSENDTMHLQHHTENDTMRHQHRTLSDEEEKIIAGVKELGESFTAICDVAGESRELSNAKTKIEEAVMWAVKHITR